MGKKLIKKKFKNIKEQADNNQTIDESYIMLSKVKYK
jgi:hypothetical protein